MQEDIEEWTSFFMLSKEQIGDPPTVVHCLLKGKTLRSPQIPALDSSASQPVSELAQAEQSTTAAQNYKSTIAEQLILDLSSDSSTQHSLVHFFCQLYHSLFFLQIGQTGILFATNLS